MPSPNNIKRSCKYCNKGFLTNQAVLNTAIKLNKNYGCYCSRKCANKANETVFTKEQLGRIAKAKMGKNNPMWKGSGVGYFALHQWLRRNMKKPEKCEICGKRKMLEFANKSGKYRRNFDNWMCICRKCHMIDDGRLERLHEHRT